MNMLAFKWDLSKTIRDYEYTRRAEVNLKRIVDSQEFKDRDSDTIFAYLRDQMEIVSFGDYLKRFIYEKTGMREPFSEVPERVYASWIDDSFDRNRAPHAFSPVHSRWSGIVRRWLSDGSVERATVFLLGFGLNMTDREVSMFLMKVLKEQDFDFCNSTEVIYWYCFHHGYHYADVLEMLADLRGFSGRTLLRDEKSREAAESPCFWESVQPQLTVYLSNETMLRAYLHYLQVQRGGRQTAAERQFAGVYQRAVAAARKLLNEDGREKEEKSASGAYDIERVLYSGVPRNRDRNLLPLERSVLVKQFGKKRLGRQKLGKLIAGEKKPERFDLLTLLFLDYAAKDFQNATKRFQQFIDEANAMLKGCGMWEVYPVNPYESFLLMCLLTGDPLCTYNDVWENSYEQG